MTTQTRQQQHSLCRRLQAATLLQMQAQTRSLSPQALGPRQLPLQTRPSSAQPSPRGIQAESGFPPGVIQLSGPAAHSSAQPHSQRRLTQQLTKHWPQFKALRQHYASTRFEEQHQLHLPQKHKTTVPESSLRVEMNALEEQADNNKASDLYWKPLSWLGTIRPPSGNDAFDPNLWATCVSTTLG